MDRKCKSGGHCPRPQMVRESWKSLDGEWEFAFDDEDVGLKERWQDGLLSARTIKVPFTYETAASGIHDTSAHRIIWYQKLLDLEPEEGKHFLIHFEGSDYHTEVYINGSLVCVHEGAYERFSVDLADRVVTGKNVLILRITDTYEKDQPRGKQRWLPNNYECWYVQTTGIWKSVWYESVPNLHIDHLKITPILDKAAINLEIFLNEEVMLPYFVLAEIGFKGKLIKSVPIDMAGRYEEAIVTVLDQESEGNTMHLWSPDDPALYDLELILMQGDREIDRVKSYFGMREVAIHHGKILLNGSPLYQKLILDQGYWKDSGLTPYDEEALLSDIEQIKKLGFNGLRKHMKTEDERFLYWCDVKGILVWCEMPACYTYNDRSVSAMTNEWIDIIKQNYNHPSIITWTPFNESWGIDEVRHNTNQQNFTEGIYKLTKSLDPMRPVICNDGWEHTCSDILTIHDYLNYGSQFVEKYKDHKEELVNNKIPIDDRPKYAMAEGYLYQGQPVIFSEVGGIAFADTKGDEWGYGRGAADEEAFLERYKATISAILEVPYIVGFCYTQLTDVQQEVNGLLKEDRTYKVSPEKIREINRGSEEYLLINR